MDQLISDNGTSIYCYERDRPPSLPATPSSSARLVMATSSSDGSCTAPGDFELSSEIEEVLIRHTLNVLKCPICCKNKRNFYCRQCVQNGDFVHSTSVYSER